MRRGESELRRLLNQEKSHQEKSYKELDPYTYVYTFCEEYGIPEGYATCIGRIMYANNVKTIEQFMELDPYDFLNGRSIGPKRAYESYQVREVMRKIHNL